VVGRVGLEPTTTRL